jgi:hypothetical protein
LVSSQLTNHGAAANDPDYRQSLADWNSFVEKLSERMTEIDDTIPELPVKDLVRLSLCLLPQQFEKST